MKRTILFITSLVLMVGCSQEPINIETLVERDEVFYTKDTNKPYTGPVFSNYDIERKKEEGTLKDGKKDGLWTKWFENGQIHEELNFKDGKEHGEWRLWIFHGDNYIKLFEGNFEKGIGTGLLKLNEDLVKDGYIRVPKSGSYDSENLDKLNWDKSMILEYFEYDN